VHESGRPPAPNLRYVDQVVGAESSLEFRFSQGVLSDFDVDVVHVADPRLDYVLGTRGAGGWHRLFASLVFARNLRRHRVALVRTLHSPDDRRRGWGWRLSERVLDRATTTFVVLEGSAATPDGSRTTVIPHPHFRDRYVGYPRGEIVEGRLLCISAGDLPSEAKHLLAIPHLADTNGLTLRLAGTASRALAESVRSTVAQQSGIVSARLEPMSDGAQVQEIQSAELVVIPRTTSMSDVQLVHLVLSLDRPVLVPHSEAMARLAGQVGPAWVLLSEGSITTQSVDTAFEAIRSNRRSTRPTLDNRGLSETHAAYEAAFRAASASVRSRMAHRGL
jgi:beta-1,4-mannosyltransferase